MYIPSRSVGDTYMQGETHFFESSQHILLLSLDLTMNFTTKKGSLMAESIEKLVFSYNYSPCLSTAKPTKLGPILTN